jgi:hypothetical protein
MFTAHHRGGLAARRLGVMAAGLAAAAALLALPTGFGAANAATRVGAIGTTTKGPAVTDPNLFASVSATGTLVAGSPGTSVTNIGTGQYEVTFGQNVAGCAYVATTINAYSQALQATVASGHLSANGVYVETKNQGGGLTAGPFNLVVDCGQPHWSYAVVGYSENLVRSSSGVSLTTLGTGRYDVTFPASVKGCAYLASVGDPGNGIDTSPAGVYTGSSANHDQVYIETKNTGGGLTAGIPFQLAVICPSATDAHFAVVNASGLPARASSLTSSYNASTGQYAMITSASLASCAEVATRGSVNTSVPYTPATVEIVPGVTGAVNTIGIQVRDLLNFGGGLDDQSFHAAAIC